MQLRHLPSLLLALSALSMPALTSAEVIAAAPVQLTFTHTDAAPVPAPIISDSTNRIPLQLRPQPTPNRKREYCYPVPSPAAAHPATSRPIVRTSLELDPATGWSEVVVELCDWADKAGAALTSVRLTNTPGRWNDMMENRTEYVDEWSVLLPERTIAEVEAMVDCARGRTREWHAPLPRRPELCRHTPLSHAGTPTYFQTTMQLDYETLADLIVVDFYASLNDAREAANLLADANRNPFGFFREGQKLHTDQTLFGPYPSTPEKWAAFREQLLSFELEEHLSWRTEEELGALIDCAQERAEREAKEGEASA